MNTKSNAIMALSLSLIFSYGCSSFNSKPPQWQTLNSELVHNTLLCGDDINQPGLSWITDAEALNQRFKHFNEESATSDSMPLVNFAERDVILVAMGPQPSSGYRLNPLEQPPRYDGEILEVEVAWQEPEPDSAQAQVLTNPCLLLSIPKVDFNYVRIIDQDGVIKLNNIIE